VKRSRDVDGSRTYHAERQSASLDLFFVPELKPRERGGQKFDSSDRLFFGLRLANSWPSGQLLDSTQPQTILSLVADCRFT